MVSSSMHQYSRSFEDESIEELSVIGEEADGVNVNDWEVN